MKLITEPNLADPDGIYARLIALHDNRSKEESVRINARLILLLANHIGHEDILLQALSLAGREKLS
jgi:Protein of unknown function (DUF2783).